MEDISDYLVHKKHYIELINYAINSYNNELRNSEYMKKERIKRAEVHYNLFIEKKLKVMDSQRTNKKVFEHINKLLPDELTQNIFEFLDGNKDYKRKELNAELLFYAKSIDWRNDTIKKHIAYIKEDLNNRIFRYKKHEEFMKNVYMVNGKYHIKKEGMGATCTKYYICVCSKDTRISEKGFKAHFNKSTSHHENMIKKVKNDDRKFINFQDELINNKDLQKNYNWFIDRY